MIDLNSLPEEALNQMRREFRKEFNKRGWKAYIPYSNLAGHYFVTRADGKKLHIFSSTPPTTSYAAASLANNKYATHKLLEGTDVPQLDTIRLREDGDFNEALDFLSKKHKVVVKPIDGGHGKGITVGVQTRDGLEMAVKTGLAATRTTRAVIVQEQYPHDKIYDLRVLCIDYKHVASIQRIPARVFGDGVKTVGELIEQENAQDNRGKAYQAPLAVIDVEIAKMYLKDKIDYIPAEKEEVQVIGVSNYGAGGETLDVTDDIPDWLIEYAEEVSRVCGLPVSGVDFMLAASPKKDMSKDELDPSLTEVNKAPLLTMHDTPTYGVSRNAFKQYIDYLESI